MSSRKSVRKQKQKPKTNWTLIGGVVAAFLLIFGAMAFFANRAPAVTDLGSYCDEYPTRCVSWGAEDAPVTVLEVSDYGCPHCRDFNEETAPQLLRQYVETGQVRWMVLPFALGVQTIPPANALLCAKDSAQVVRLHEGLFGLQEVGFVNDNILSVAENAGISLSEPSSLVECVEDGAYNRVVSENIAAANAVGVNSTPTFFINGELVRGAQPLAVFQQKIDSFLTLSQN
jgi:protein-disulfide isomerase